MNKKIDKDSYQKLITEISSIYEKTRFTVVVMYWHIGKYIVEAEQNKPKDGEYVLNRLSADLSDKYGKGFSKTNLKNMRLFYKTYTLGQISDRLEWSNYVTLLAVKDDRERKLLEERAINEKLKYKELRRVARSEGKGKRKSSSLEAGTLEPVRGRLHTCSLIDPSRADVPEGSIIVDCGFNIWKNIPVKNVNELSGTKYISFQNNKYSFKIKPAYDLDPGVIYTYKAHIEKIIDGDTMWVIVDCGFHSYTRQKLRLKGIDTPEMDSDQGKKAKRFVERMLRSVPFIIVKTYKSDKYDRYLSDILYLPGEVDPEKVCGEGRFLNRELVEKGLAVVV